ncbi:MAG: hypothetical protein WCA09_16920 [Burkholderiales bacterium]
MKLLNDLLGLAVLTSPLWLIVISLVIGIWIAIVAAKHFKFTGRKVTAGAGVVVVIFLALFGDEIAGRVYLGHLCATGAGVNVYQTVELPAEYWDAAGRPKFYDPRNGNFFLGENYSYERKTERYSSIFHIDRSTSTLVNKTRDREYGQITSFMDWGGWMRRNLSPANSAVSCGNYLEQHLRLMREVFKQSNSK